jgi:methylmalonyl-CoA mutase C-terminal domain/subunit
LERKIRVLIAKPGLDGHDRGAKVVAQALRDAGMEVIYMGLHKTVDEIVAIATQEDVDVIGLSILSGAHLPICQKLFKKMSDERISDKLLVVGGVIPTEDAKQLRAIGVNGIFPSGTKLFEIVTFINNHVS